MMKNMSKKQRSSMIVIGLGIIGWGIFASNWWGLVGLLPLVSGLLGFCVLCNFAGKCSLPKQGSEDKPKSGGSCCGH
jgi:hypothetical protein